MTQTVEVEKGMEPLPCPFCGGKRGNPQNYGDTRDWRHRFVECLDCFANLYRFRDTQAEADADLNEAWNRRTPSTLTEENARLKDRVRELVTLLDNQLGTPCEQIRHADEVDRLLQENKAMREDAENWRALMACPRIRLYGWAGVDDQFQPKPKEYVHFGADFWSSGPVDDEQSGPAVTAKGVALLKALAADIRARTILTQGEGK